MKKLKKHRWDETLVIAVMVASAIGILILIAGYISVTGEAAGTAPTKSGIIDLLNKASVETGSGKTKCNIVCSRLGKICILARSGEEVIACSTKINGDYSCVCASP